MKYVKSIFALILAMAYPLNGFAQSDVPDKGFERVLWMSKSCGAMPSLLVKALVAIAVMIIISVITAKVKEGKCNE